MSGDAQLIGRLLDLAFSKPGALQPASDVKDSLLRRIRARKGKSQADIAKQLKMTSQAISGAEANEADGSIQLKTLAKIAEALGYTLIYTLVPTASVAEAKGLSVISPDQESAERAAGRPGNPLVLTLLRMVEQAEAGKADLDPFVYENVYRPAKPGA